MNCCICASSLEFFLTKEFHEFGLDQVDYLKCPRCGFVMSATHAELSPAEWGRLNEDYHAQFLGKEVNHDDPRWLTRLDAQAKFIDRAARCGLIGQERPWLDFACGDGKLSDRLQARHGRALAKYERYALAGAASEDFLGEEDLQPGGFDFVLTTSVFEHLILREDFDRIDALVSRRGAMGLHTLVRETIPQDPTWFYFLPVHCAFHTNASMSLLLEQWGYRHSVYDVESRLWLCFRETPQAQLAHAAQHDPDGSFLHQPGFIGYWK